MLAALEAHQLDFMATAVPSSTSASQYNRKPSTTIEKQQHTWEDMDDEYDDAEAVTDENSDSEDSVDEEDRKGETLALPRLQYVDTDTSVYSVSTSRVPEVAIFQDPSASNSAPTVFSFAEPAGSAGLGTNKDMKKFMVRCSVLPESCLQLSDDYRAVIQSEKCCTYILSSRCDEFQGQRAAT